MKEALRRNLKQALPDVTVSFEAGDIVSQVMSFGSPTPIEVAVQGPTLAASRPFADKVYARAGTCRFAARSAVRAAARLSRRCRSRSIANRAGQFGVTSAEVARSLVAATSSSRFTDPNYWRDPASGNGFQIQVEIPQSKIASIGDVGEPALSSPERSTGVVRPLVADLARVDYGTTSGEVDRYNMQRVISFTANIHGEPLGAAVREIRDAIGRAGAPPRGVNVFMRGQVPAFEETLSGLRTGLLLSVVVIFLLLAANFPVVPAGDGRDLAGAGGDLWRPPHACCSRGTTLNVQSFMGAIMAIGISVANAILLVTFAEKPRDGRARPSTTRVCRARAAGCGPS